MQQDSITGGPAFPIPLQPGQSYNGHAPCDGMTLRDYFAAKAMAGMLAAPPGKLPAQNNGADVARDAYMIADAMLKAREAAIAKATGGAA